MQAAGKLPNLTAGDTNARPFRSPLRYPGGKQKALHQIAAMLPSRRFAEYREPMVGGGSVFFHARSIDFADSYWINDLFSELYCFWKTVQSAALCKRMKCELEQLRSSFSNAKEIKRFFLNKRGEAPQDEYEAAVLFFFFNRVTFSGTTRAGGFSSAAALRRFTASSIERLAPLPVALKGTKITNEDFESVIQAPGKDVFLFLDPPYFTAQKLYGSKGELHRFDHERLAYLLKRSNHKFLITYDDCPQIRALYRGKDLQILPWELQYGMNNCNLKNLSKRGSEIFIRNYR